MWIYSNCQDLEDSMKKILFIFILIFISYFHSSEKVSAFCDPRTIPNICQGGTPYSCTNTFTNQLYCCSITTTECDNPPPNTCLNGVQNNQTFCDPDDNRKVMLCESWKTPQYSQSEYCDSSEMCSNGACVANTQTCSNINPNDTPNGAIVCRGNPAHPFQCAAGAPEEFFQVATCNASQECVDGVGCRPRVNPTPTDVPPGPTPTNVPPPPDPLLPNDSFLIMVNPFTLGGVSGIINLFRFSKPGGILSALLPWLFTFAGLILFVMLLWGGFEMLSGAATPQSQQAGKQRITAALTGFALLFMSYWFAQIIEYIFGLNIL